MDKISYHNPYTNIYAILVLKILQRKQFLQLHWNVSSIYVCKAKLLKKTIINTNEIPNFYSDLKFHL